jgi:glutamate dehydrogenase/leucine dehydrogenase
MTALFDRLNALGHEGIFVVQDDETGLKGFIALHNTSLGPALGGCRMMHYPTEEAAFEDVLKLSEAMTYKNALADLHYGGGKAVIWLQPGQVKTPELVRAMGKRIGALRGAYFTATDIGSTSADMEIMKDATPYVSALPPEKGGLGDSAILTGLGVFQGIKSAVAYKHGQDSLEGLTIAIQGAGKVAYHMLTHLKKEYEHAHFNVVLADTYAPAVDRCVELFPQIKVVEPDEIWQVKADILSPNAVGGTLTSDVIAQTQASVIAGGANNPLSKKSVADEIRQKGILFAPDFAINSGGVIVLSTELAKGTLEEATEKTKGIYETAQCIFQVAEERGINTLDAAISLAKERIEAASKRPTAMA